MAKNFITLQGHKTINLDYVISIEYVGTIAGSMLGEFIIKNHRDGNAYIKYTLSNGEFEFWTFDSEETAQTEYNKIVARIVD